ncbi:MAG TPA: peptidase U32 family protein, partial [Candidatus Hydrogenedentes bacterium]|nr:peptidase U32 family protein [Candidatus Hydrogenedentota bacterium]
MPARPTDAPAGPARPPELLAPAGRMEAFLAALDAGADAVYVGAHQFNARLRAQNFTRDDLARMAALAHDLGRKLYITLNTLVRDDELGDVAALLDDLRRIGPDALILQDLGVLRLARTLCPEIPLHASTQMTIHNADGALAAQKMGFERVVLARELTVDEIRAVRNACPVALEVFIHGALCYSVSGQCLFSSHVHGKSANRGLCLQPCRRAFFDGAGHKGNAYSTRDLDATPVLGRLVEAGVSSLKIEGRLKPAETVAQIVRAYRLLLDAWPRIGREEAAEARRLLDSAVGRESCTGYLSAPRPAGLLGAVESQSGRRIGTTAPCRTPGHIAFRPTEPLSAGDRLRVQARPGQPPVSVTVRELLLDGRPVKRVQAGRLVEVAVPCPVPAGVAVVKAADAGARPKGFQNRLEKLEARMGRAEKARFPVQVRTGQGGVTLKAEAGAG